MAIAGGTKPAFLLRWDGERLINLGQHRPMSHIVVDDVAEAVELLRKGKSIYLFAYTNNLRDVKNALGVA